MEFFLEVILQCLFEFVLQLILEVFGEIGFQSCRDCFKQRKVQNPWIAAVCYFVLGALVGWGSLFVFKASFIHNPAIRLTNLFLTPVLIGGIMALIGWLRRENNQELVRLDRFGYGFLFAFGMALVRFFFTSSPH